MTTSAVSKRYFSVKEASRYTGLPASTLYDWAAQGTIPSIKIRRRVLFDLEDIDRIMTKQKRELVNPDKKANEILRGALDGI